MESETTYFAAGRQAIPMGEAPSREPLLSEIMGNTSRHADLANEIASRVYSLKDRLFGPELASGANAASTQKPPQSFADSYSEQSSRLGQMLAYLDALTCELNNRL